MTTTQALVVDANILVRAVLGVRVFQLLNKYEGKVSFYSPAKCFEEARQHLPVILEVIVDVVFIMRRIDVNQIRLKVVILKPASTDGARGRDRNDVILHALVADVGEELVVER